MRLLSLSCGSLGIPSEYLTPGAEAGKLVRTTVGWFLLEHPGGLLLYDTGSAPEVVEDAAAYWGVETAATFPPRIGERDIADRRLRELGFDPRDVRHVVLSHLHPDHAGGMKLFPGARFYVQTRELADAFWPLPGFDAGCYVLADLLPTRRFDLVKLEGDLDLFGDGSVRILSTPGHSTGHQSLALRLPHTGHVVLPGDACFCEESLKRRLPPGEPLPLPGAWRRSLERVQTEVDRGATPLFSHVPLDESDGDPDAPRVLD